MINKSKIKIVKRTDAVAAKSVNKEKEIGEPQGRGQRDGFDGHGLGFRFEATQGTGDKGSL